MTEIQEILQDYNNLADELKERTKRLEELEQEMENTGKPNLQQVSECYSHQCDLVLQKFAERLKDKILNDKSLEDYDWAVLDQAIDKVLKELIK